MLLLIKVENNDEEKARKFIGKEKKLILHFYDKERYVIHHEMLKFLSKTSNYYVIIKVHKIITL